MGIAIRVEHLSKEYRLGVFNHGMLYKDMQSWLAMKTGRTDPHAKIGTELFADQEDRFWALKDLNFEIAQGDRVGIIGKNGAGKSTLLKILSRITAPTEGVAKLKGRVTSLLEVGTGFNGELTGRENIYLNGAILGMKKREIARKLDEIIDFSEIGQHIDTPVKRYSSGMYVRLAFAVAAHLNSEILIADEVLAVGDASFQKKALGKMQELSSGQGRTVLFVSHNIEAVKQLCTSGIILEKGKIVSMSQNILALTKEYLHENVNEDLQRTEWTNDGRENHPEFRPDRFAIVEEGGSPIERPIDASRRYRLELEFTVIDLSPYLNFEFQFWDDESMIFVASPFYSVAEYRPQKGHNVISLTIPSGLFCAKPYRIQLVASLHNLKWILEPGVNSPYIVFEVDRYINFHPYYRANIGLIHPTVNWAIGGKGEDL